MSYRETGPMLVHILGSSHPHYQGLACHTHSLHELLCNRSLNTVMRDHHDSNSVDWPFKLQQEQYYSNHLKNAVLFKVHYILHVPLKCRGSDLLLSKETKKGSIFFGNCLSAYDFHEISNNTFVENPERYPKFCCLLH